MMGTIRNGGNGAFSGKTRSFIGSHWPNVNYIKGISKPKSQKPLDQQACLALAVCFLLPVKRHFSKAKQSYASSYNTALQRILSNAVWGVYPDYEIDYPGVSFSQGSLSEPADVTLMPSARGLTLSWSNQVLVTNGHGDDLFTVLVNDAESNTYVVDLQNITRSSEEVTALLSSYWLGRG